MADEKKIDPENNNLLKKENLIIPYRIVTDQKFTINLEVPDSEIFKQNILCEIFDSSDKVIQSIELKESQLVFNPINTPGQYLIKFKIGDKYFKFKSFLQIDKPIPLSDSDSELFVENFFTKFLEKIPKAQQKMNIRTVKPVPEKNIPDAILFALIDLSTNAINYSCFDKRIKEWVNKNNNKKNEIRNDTVIPKYFYDLIFFKELKQETESFLIENCGIKVDQDQIKNIINSRFSEDVGNITETKIRELVNSYFKPVNERFKVEDQVLPYLQVSSKDMGLSTDEKCNGFIRDKVYHPLMLELIWSYFHELSGLKIIMQSISSRFQNRKTKDVRKNLENLRIDPLRPLSNVLWGYLMDQINRTTLDMRNYEYLHAYNFHTLGGSHYTLSSIDNRTNFIIAFHNLINITSRYYKELDDAMIYADPFPVRNALRDLHITLCQGDHNMFRDLQWTSRVEMLMEMWILGRPEMQEFLGGSHMVKYEEDWMKCADNAKNMLGLASTSVSEFHNLAIWGEKILLSARYGDWTDNANAVDRAAYWAQYFREQIQGYIHSYRSVTSVDLTSSEKLDYTIPAVLVQKRLADERRAA